MNIIAWIVFGALAGGAVRMLSGDKNHLNLFAHLATGSMGALIGCFLVNLFGVEHATGFDFNLHSLWIAVLGAVGLSLLVHLARRAVLPV